MKTPLGNSLGAALGLSILLNVNAAESGKLRSMIPSGSVLTPHLLSGAPISFSALTLGNGMWVALGGDTFFTSTDAIRWTSSLPLPDVQLRGLVNSWELKQSISVSSYVRKIAFTRDGQRFIGSHATKESSTLP